MGVISGLSPDALKCGVRLHADGHCGDVHHGPVAGCGNSCRVCHHGRLFYSAAAFNRGEPRDRSLFVCCLARPRHSRPCHVQTMASNVAAWICRNAASLCRLVFRVLRSQPDYAYAVLRDALLFDFCCSATANAAPRTRTRNHAADSGLGECRNVLPAGLRHDHGHQPHRNGLVFIGAGCGLLGAESSAVKEL